MLVFWGVGLLDKKESWWFSFQPLRKIRCVKHGNLPKRGAVEHQKNSWTRKQRTPCSCTMKNSAAPTVHKWHPSRTAPRRCRWTWKNVDQTSWKWQQPWQTVYTLLKFNLYRPWKVTWPQKEAGSSSIPTILFRGELLHFKGCNIPILLKIFPYT